MDGVDHDDTKSSRRSEGGDGLDGRELGAVTDTALAVLGPVGLGVLGNLATDGLKASVKAARSRSSTKVAADRSRPCAEARILMDHLVRTAVRDRCRTLGLRAPGYDELTVDDGEWEPDGRRHDVRHERTRLTATVHVALHVRSSRPRVVVMVNQAAGSEPGGPVLRSRSGTRVLDHEKPVVSLPDDHATLVRMIDRALDDPSLRDVTAAERLDRLPGALRARQARDARHDDRH